MKKNILLFLFCFTFSFVFGNDWHITQNIPPLATTYTSPGNIIIYPGVNYTINYTGILKMPAGKKITIMPGGKLTIDGGQINSTGVNIMWDGVYVLSNAQAIGAIEVKSGAKMQNAKIAIRTWDGSYRNTSGGIVKISDATFTNNRIALQIVSDFAYNAFDMPYVRTSTFIVDNNNYFSSNSLSFRAHAEVDSRSFTFRGCTFKNLTSTSITSTAKGYGIIAYNSALNINDYCVFYKTICDCGEGSVRSYFSGFNKAVYYSYSGEGTRNKLNVRNTDFENNWSSIYSAGKNCDITKCKFTLPTYISGYPSGIQLYNCTGYKIEENVFTSSLLSVSNCYPRGIYISNSGIAENLIYRNDFQWLHTAIYVYGSNGVINGSGLQFQCNNFKSNRYDFYLAENSTVASQQGSSSKGAGNTFDGSTMNIHGNSYMNILYYYSGVNSSTNIYRPGYIEGRVGTQNGAVVNDCKPKNCNAYIKDTAILIKDSLISFNDFIGMRDIVINYDNLNDQYSNLVADFYEKGYDWTLENYKANSKGTSEIDQEAVIAFEKLNQISELNTIMTEISNENIWKLLDTQDADLEQFIEWYEKINTPAAKYSLANSYYENGEYDKALQVLSNIPDMFNFEQKELAEHDDYMLIHKLRDNLRTSNRYWDKLTEAEISLLEKIAVNTIGPSSAKAQGILCFFYDNCIEIEQKNIPMNEMKETTKINVDVYPNPAKNILNIDFSDEIEGNAQIEFYDIMGRKVYSHNINTTSSQINISELSNGVYTYRIIYNDNEMTHDKFIKQ